MYALSQCARQVKQNKKWGVINIYALRAAHIHGRGHTKQKCVSAKIHTTIVCFYKNESQQKF
jgi:hypothetical protein